MKNNITLKSILTLFALLFAISTYAQERTCGMLEYMEEQLKDPVFAKEYEKNQKKLKEEVARRIASGEYLNRGGVTVEIPVAVHFPGANEADRACLEALAQNQIDILNADYTATNGDIGLWAGAAPFFPGLAPGVANISFCIATTNHPVGIDPDLLEGNPAVTIGYNFGGGAGNPDANWSGYMNFVVRNIGGGLLGFSPLNGSITAGQAVTMNTFAFGSGAGCPGSGIVPGSPFNLGRTVTHELGHFYGLNHPWGPGAPSCAADDGFSDTPNTGQETYGCPANGSETSCGNTVLTMNYMDYVNDACMFMFTPQQMAQVDAYVSGILQPQFKPDVCTPGTPGFNLITAVDTVSSCPNTDTSVDFDFTYVTVLDFDETTTFSASGAPAGANVTFSPTSLNAGGDFTMTVGNLGATALGTYTITVTATSNSVTETIDVTLENNCTEIVCNTEASGQNLGIAIPDGQDLSGTNPGAPVSTTLTVADSQIIDNIKVNVDISHTYISDLLITITHPDGVTEAVLWDGECVNEDDLDITFDDEGAAVVCGNPTVGTFTPNEALSIFSGLDAQGDWTLTVQDFFSQDPGVINDWSVEVCSEVGLSVNEFDVNGFAIFPNPNNGEFTIKLNSNSGNDIKVDIFDIRGRRIFNNSFTNTGDFSETISLNSVQSGMYLVTVNDGNSEVTKRIVVE